MKRTRLLVGLPLWQVCCCWSCCCSCGILQGQARCTLLAPLSCLHTCGTVRRTCLQQHRSLRGNANHGHSWHATAVGRGQLDYARNRTKRALRCIVIGALPIVGLGCCRGQQKQQPSWSQQHDRWPAAAGFANHIAAVLLMSCIGLE